MNLGRAYDNIREKGTLKKDGKTYKRQPKIKKVLKGKETTISFAFNRIVKGFYGIIEADDLQPSHSSGVQNPLHFLPEAQPRNRSTSQSGRETPQLIARNLRPSEIIEGANAYTGAPIANLRGEVIQGNGRADTLKIYYSLEPNGKTYNEYFFTGCNANFLGFSARTIKKELAKFQKPVLIRFVDVSDEEFIQLGQFQAKDLEAVSSESSDTKAKVNRISETDLAKMVEALLRYDRKDDSLSEIIRNSKALTYFVRAKVLRNDELEKYTKNGETSAKGVEFVRQFLLQFVFEQSKEPNTSEKFNNLPHHTQRGVEKALLYVLKVHCYSDCEQSNHSITKEVGNAIGAAYDLLQTNLSFNEWKNQPSTFEAAPVERYSSLELELAKIFSEGKTQKSIVDRFKQYAYYATDKEATLVEPKQKALPKAEAIKKSFGLSGIDGCECDNVAYQDTETITVKLPVSINTFKKYGNSVLWDKQKTRNLSDSEFITLWKYTLAANTMLSDSIFPKTKHGDRHVLAQYGKKELVNSANKEFVRRGLDKKYTLFTERKEKKSIPKKITSKQSHTMTFEEFSKKTLLTKARDDFSDMTFYFYFVGWKNDEVFISDSEDLKAIKDTRKDYKEFNTLRDVLTRNSIYSVFPNRPKKAEEVKREAYKIYLQNTYPTVEPTSNPKNEELEIAIAKMKMLKLKAKALQMKDLEGLLYGLEHIYDDSELDGIGLDGLDGKDVYEIVNEKVLETIERGNLSWRKTWKIKSRGGAAANYDSKRAYSGANFFLLNFILPLMGDDYEYPYFLTFKQIKAKKGKIKKGSKGYPIFYYNVVRKYQGKKITDDEYKRLKAQGVKNIEQIRFLKYYTVFNIAAVEDVEFDLTALEKGEKVNYEYEAIEAAEKIYHYMPNKPSLKVDSQAYYFPKEDYVGMPPVVTFEKPQAFYSVLYHELIHSTKHPIRLDDKTRGGKKFGDKDYALEELVAELGACYLCAESGILFHTINNSAAYLKGWNEKLVASIKEDKTFFLKAAARAQRASDYILDYDKNGVPAYQRNEYYEPIPLNPSIVKTPTKVVKSTENEDIEIAIAKMKMLQLKAKALQL
ncbi:zincin-like metallopeptidase domain-containing protein [Bernardetia sp.]|uniref:zincin-like metallopeptidase domain-containing protein n=1 Tax=Bernardetia sp. TaxID=1937974 RepID=UPI0025BD3958|nr:zincin-like metallopeptidase domain-containing protein [Bernardetia sp.]